MAIFHCGIRISSENIVLIPVEDENPARRGMKNLPLSQESFNMLYVPPHGVQELILQYRLRPHRNKEMSYLSYLDVDTFLHNDQPGSCGFERDMGIQHHLQTKPRTHFMPMLVKNVPDSKSGSRIPFKTTFASGSAPAGDL